MRLIRWAVVLIAALALMGQDGCETETTEKADDKTEQRSDKGSDDDEPTPQPDGEYSTTCAYLLGDFSEGSSAGYRFVAGGELENTGNVGIVAKLTAKWTLLGTSPATASKTVRIPVGRTKDVQMTRLATQNEIDAHQSANGKCSAKVDILDTFGKPQ